MINYPLTALGLLLMGFSIFSLRQTKEWGIAFLCLVFAGGLFLVTMSNFKISTFEAGTGGIKATLKEHDVHIKGLKGENEKFKTVIDKLAELTWNRGRLSGDDSIYAIQYVQENDADDILRSFYGDKKWLEIKLEKLQNGKFMVPDKDKDEYIKKTKGEIERIK